MKGTLGNLMLGARQERPLTSLKARVPFMAGFEIDATMLSRPGDAMLMQIKS